MRLGIAACQLKLGDLTSAQAAFERVMVLDPGSADAHLGLAVIRLNSANVQQVGREGGKGDRGGRGKKDQGERRGCDGTSISCLF